MESGRANEKGSELKPNTNDDAIYTNDDPGVEPQEILREIGNAIKDQEGIVVTPDAAQQARKESSDTQED